MQHSTKTRAYFFLLILSTLFACHKDQAVAPPASGYTNGVFIANQGKYPGPGEISFFSRDSGKIVNDIYSKANAGASPGSVIQSVSVWNGKAYIAANNSKKIVVVDAATFKYIETIDSSVVTFPTYFLGIDDSKAYVSDWGKNGVNGSVYVYDLKNKKTTKTLSVGKGADKMLRIGNTVYVANTGGFDKDSVIGIIDVTSDAIKTLKVGVNCNSITKDVNGDVWALCGGAYTDAQPAGKLARIHNGVVDKTITVAAFSSSLIADPSGKSLYFINGDGTLKALDVASATVTALDIAGIASVNPGALDIDPKTGYLFVADAKDFSSNGVLYVIDAVSKTVKYTLSTGVAPGAFWFL